MSGPLSRADAVTVARMIGGGVGRGESRFLAAHNMGDAWARACAEEVLAGSASGAWHAAWIFEGLRREAQREWLVIERRNAAIREDTRLLLRKALV